MMVSIFLDPMTDAERAKNLPLLQNEFRSLPNYVPDSVSIMGSTLYWKATIQLPQTEQHKLDAIAILRRNNVRLSKFSEDWLKNQARLRGNASAK